MMSLDLTEILKLLAGLGILGFLTTMGYRAFKYGRVKNDLKESQGREKAFQQSLEKQSERERNHEKRLETILDGPVSTDDLSSMLSDYPAENRETHRSKAPAGRSEEGKRR
jgi:hypothetical protein